MIYTAWPGSSLFPWHPTLMTLAFVAGMFEALMVFNRESSLFLNASRPTKVLVHHVLQVFAIVCALSGFGVIFYNKMLNDKPHFTTWHGLFGVITICSLPLAAVGGNVVKYQFLRDMLRIKITLAQLKIYHATGGLIVFTMVMITLMLSLYSNWFTGNVSGILWYACAMCVSFMAVVVMNQVTQEYLPKTRRQSVSPQKSGSQGNKESKKKK
ncbi:hypothetical protein DPMN_004341 [Dreissena polymorpha]|uniref:ascorbate ferrireductase (transmembrane) n=2 Tax=Dreissena polymorpha TaxID=45954 RepID=A0A9D4RVU1_DREPO|nr:hypothetical protein DPMN_004341 [Dreissena polymorpha]